MFDDLSSLDNETEKASDEKDEPSRWLSRWSHVFAALAFCLLYFPLTDHPWCLYIAIAGSFSVFVFAIALGLGLDTADVFFGDPQVTKYVAIMLLPHILVLILIMSATYLWLRVESVLPLWATESRRLPLWDLVGLVVFYLAGTREGIWMGAKIKRQFQTPDD